MEQQPTELEQLHAQREQYRSKAFMMLVQLIAIFGVPAFAAVFFGKRLDAQYDTGRQWQLLLLAVAFVLSWTVTIRMFIKLDRKAREVDTKIKQHKQS